MTRGTGMVVAAPICLRLLRSGRAAGSALRLTMLGLGLFGAACQPAAPVSRPVSSERSPIAATTASAGLAPATVAQPATAATGLPPGAPPAVEETRPVYPSQLDGPASPQAQTLCRALHDLPAERRRACCAATSSVVLTADCVRVLSFAQRSGALRIDEGALSACVSALQQTYSGCDWVGPWPPELPAECRAVLHGQLAAAAPCRSSLECQAGLFCHGASPTAMGTCGPPRIEGERCGLAVDGLAAYLRMAVLTEPHPQFVQHRECEGFCNLRHVCESLRPRSATCVMSVQCGVDDRCGRGQCIAGRVAKLGEACSGGDCPAGLRCFEHVCQKPKPAGQSCQSDFECTGGCERPPGAEHGVCAAKCSAS